MLLLPVPVSLLIHLNKKHGVRNPGIAEISVIEEDYD
jgi:hypothetical protein